MQRTPRSCESSALLRKSNTSLHTNFYDVGWRVDATGRVVIVGHRQPGEGCVGSGPLQNANVMLGVPGNGGPAGAPMVLRSAASCSDSGRLQNVVRPCRRIVASGQPLVIVHGGGKEN